MWITNVIPSIYDAHVRLFGGEVRICWVHICHRESIVGLIHDHAVQVPTQSLANLVDGAPERIYSCFQVSRTHAFETMLYQFPNLLHTRGAFANHQKHNNTRTRIYLVFSISALVGGVGEFDVARVVFLEL